MAGLAEILAENERLRGELQERSVAHAEERASWQSELELERAKLEAVQRRAEQLAYSLEMLQLRKGGSASYRFTGLGEGQGALPFTGDTEAPPRRAEAEPTEPEPTEAEGKTPSAPSGRTKKKRGKPKRRNLATDTSMPHQPVHCPVDETQTCARCGEPLQVIGQAESCRVNWVPGHFVIHDVKRDKCACSSCPGEGVLTVPGPYALPRAICANGLLARVLVDKFADHIPLNRQARRMAREGFDVGTNTLSGWVGAAAGLLGLVAEAVWRDLAQAPVLQSDDTGHPVQDGSQGELRKGRLWVYTDQQQAVYRFTPTKEGEHPANHLKDFKGKLFLVDGGSEYNQATQDHELVRGGCWSHLRTYFHYAKNHHPVEASMALGTLCDLFMLEREFAERQPDEIAELRQEQSKPLVDGLFDWIRGLSTSTRPNSTLGAALRYGLNQESRLREFLEHGELPMHNNLSELLLRQPVVGRKNWLFSGTEGGAEGAAVIFTLIGSCFLQGIDPHAYLEDILGRLDTDPPERLTPKAWRLARETEEARAA